MMETDSNRAAVWVSAGCTAQRVAKKDRGQSTITRMNEGNRLELSSAATKNMLHAAGMLAKGT